MVVKAERSARRNKLSKISIQGAATGTGVFTLASPATNTDRTLTLPDEAGTVLTTAGVPASALPAGSVIQVVQVHTATPSSQSVTASTPTNIIGLSGSITPSSTSSRIKISVYFSGEFSFTDAHDVVLGLKRDSTIIGSQSSVGSRLYGLTSVASGYPTNADSTQETAVCFYVDSPSTTSAVTYYPYVMTSTTCTFYLNRTSSDADNTNNERTASVMILEEIAG